MRKEVFSGGWVELLGSFGTDLDIVNSARISFNKKHDELVEGDDKLIHFLLKNRHGTPFEIPVFRFQVRAPLTVFREWQRHRISSFNEVSGRYVEMELDSYQPANCRKQVGKPGKYTYEDLDDFHNRTATAIMDSSFKHSYVAYRQLLSMGVAKEVARGVLPQNLFSEMIYQANARSLMNFMSLRSAENAMWEIRQYSLAIEEMFKQVLPITYEAFIKFGKVSP
jgi:thymidylate synthase (FAD)